MGGAALSEPTFHVARFQGKHDNLPQREEWTLAHFELELGRFKERRGKNGPLWSPASYVAGATRENDQVRAVTCLVLDFDQGHAPDDFVRQWRDLGLAFFAHSSFSNSDEHPKWRAVFPLTVPVSRGEWPEAYPRLVRRLAAGLVDAGCCDQSRMYYLPSCPPGAPRFAEANMGRLLDPSPTEEDARLEAEALAAGTLEPTYERPQPRPKPAGSKETPGDWFNRTAVWRDLVEEAGGRYLGRGGRREHYVRAGKRENEMSATTGNGRAGQDLLVNHSTNWVGIPKGCYSKFGFYTRLHWDGDFVAATRAIAAMPEYKRDAGDDDRPVRKGPNLPPGPPLGISNDLPPDWQPRIVDVVEEAEPRDFRMTDLGNAERLVEAYGDDLRHCEKAGGWFVWDDRRWTLDEVGRATFLMTRVARGIHREAVACPSQDLQKLLFKHADRSESAGGLSAALTVAQAIPGVSVPVSAFDADPWLLNCDNGVLDLRTQELRPHDPALMMTRMAGARYDARADCPTWLAFLSDVVPDPDVQRFLWRYAGYTLLGEAPEQCFVFLHGEGKNGKSTFVNTIASVMGDYSRSIEIETLMASGRELSAGQLSTIAELVNKRMVVSSEPDEGARFHESLIKRLTGGEPMVAKYMHENTFQFTPIFAMWMSGNHKPTVRGTDEGIWRRLRLVPFETVIPKEKRDGDLPKKLQAEAAGILRWMVLGLRSYLEEGLGEPEAVRQATEEYRAESDAIGLFLDARTQKNPVAQIETDRLYRVYVAWCEAGGYKPMNASWFGRKLKKAGDDRGFVAGERDSVSNVSVVKGLEILHADAPDVYRGGD